MNRSRPLFLSHLSHVVSALQWELYIKSELAYGDRQRGRHIYPGAALIFELELLTVHPQ